MSFAIGIPTLNRYDLLKPSLAMYKLDFPNINIHIINNGIENINEEAKIKVHRTYRNIGVAASWNRLCKIIFSEGHENALILNDDIYLGKKESEIIELCSTYKNSFIRATPDFCAFIISKHVWDEVGEFDECFFPAYYEDKSYDYRMKLKRIMRIKTPRLNPHIYNSSKTLEKYSELMELIRQNRTLYTKMWGGEPERETFKKPFNN